MTDPKSHPSATVSLIPAGHLGRLIAPGHDAVPVRVFERGGDELLLVVLLDGDTRGEPERSEPMLLEYSSAQGLVRLHGYATRQQRDLIRFSAQAPAEVLQRRDFVRIDAAQPVEVTDARDGTACRAHAVDISGGGMLLDSLQDFAEGQRVHFSLELGPGQPPVQGTARVVRTDGTSERGLKFEAIPSSERERLIHYIFERQRAARAKTRDGARTSRRRKQ